MAATINACDGVREPMNGGHTPNSRRDHRFSSLTWLRMRKKGSHARAATFVRSAARRTVSGLAASRSARREDLIDKYAGPALNKVYSLK
jgi:hypothetical protein